MKHFKFIRAADNKNEPVINGNDDVLENTYFNLINLNKGEEYSYLLPGHETVVVVLSGNIDVDAGGRVFAGVGKREDIWSGEADSVYTGINTRVTLTSNRDNTALAVAGGRCDKKFESFRITPGEVEMVDVGSNETNSHRRIFHILGQNAKDRAGNLLVSELLADEGCWSGYPPHKHDTDNYPQETGFEEVYHYRFNPPTGFGGQFCYRDHGENYGFMTRNGDTFAFREGYHPTVTSPGHQAYIFTILVGTSTRSLIQYFSDEYRYLMGAIPGINDMRDKFR